MREYKWNYSMGNGTITGQRSVLAGNREEALCMIESIIANQRLSYPNDNSRKYDWYEIDGEQVKILIKRAH